MTTVLDNEYGDEGRNEEGTTTKCVDVKLMRKGVIYGEAFVSDMAVFYSDVLFCGMHILV